MILEIQSTCCHWRDKELCSEKPRVAEKLTVSSPKKEKQMQFPFRTSRNDGEERRDFFFQPAASHPKLRGKGCGP